MALVIYEKRGGIAYITLNRPERHNIINRELADELIKVWADFKTDERLLVAILSGAGESFCAGVDLKEPELGQWELSQSLTLGDRPAGPARYEVWKPIIAALHGRVVGGGFWLALECDLRVAAEGTALSFSEPGIGLATLYTPLVVDYMPLGIASELLLTGEEMDARRAYQLGLVSKVVPQEKLLPTTLELAQRICSNGPLAVRAIKQALQKSTTLNFRARFGLIRDILVPMFNSEEAIEGRRAFLEKRLPKWRKT